MKERAWILRIFNMIPNSQNGFFLLELHFIKGVLLISLSLSLAGIGWKLLGTKGRVMEAKRKGICIVKGIGTGRQRWSACLVAWDFGSQAGKEWEFIGLVTHYVVSHD